MYDMRPLIQKFRDSRKRLGISQTEFARRIGTSLASITRWERGNMVYTPNLRQLALIADMLDTTVWELLAPDASITVTNDESMTGAESPRAEIESIPKEAAVVVNHEGIGEPSATPVVNTDEEQSVPSDVQEEGPSSIEGRNIVNVDEEMAEPETPGIIHEGTSSADEPMSELIKHDESLEAPQSVMSDASTSTPAADSKEMRESPLFAININGGTPQAEAAPEVQEIGSDTPQEQAVEVITSDEVTPDVEAASMGVPESVIVDETTSEIQGTVTNDETQEEEPTLPIVIADDPQTKDSSSQELFSIVTPDGSLTTPTTIAPEATASDDSLIVSNNEPAEEPDAAIVSPDDISRSVINDEIQIEESTTPEAMSIADNDEPAEDHPLASIVATDDTIEPAPVVEAIEAEQAEQAEPHGDDAAAPKRFSIITPDETRRENDAPIPNVGDEFPQEATASEFLSTVSNDEAQETAADTASEPSQEQAPVSTDTPSKPWEALGMSKAWYYRLRQQGRLEEYLREKAKD